MILHCGVADPVQQAKVLLHRLRLRYYAEWPMRQELLAGRRQLDWICFPVDEFGTDPVFERTNTSAEGRLVMYRCEAALEKLPIRARATKSSSHFKSMSKALQLHRIGHLRQATGRCGSPYTTGSIGSRKYHVPKVGAF